MCKSKEDKRRLISKLAELEWVAFLINEFKVVNRFRWLCYDDAVTRCGGLADRKWSGNGYGRSG